MQAEEAAGTKEAVEHEREKLYRLIKCGASKEDIQRQSEALDRQIVSYYSPCT